MSDDKTQEMPVMADAGDMPTETLHAVDAQSTYDQSQRSGRATQDDKPRVGSAPAQGVPTYTASVAGANDGRKNRQTGDDIIRPSGRSGSTIALGVFTCFMGVVTLLCGMHVPMNLWWWASDPKQFFVFLLGGIGVLLIAVAVIWAIVSAVRSNRSKNGGDADSVDPFDAPHSSDATAFSTDSDKSPVSERS